MLHIFIRFPEFNETTEFNKRSAPFTKKSIGTECIVVHNPGLVDN